MFSFTGPFVANPATNFAKKKKTRGAFGRIAKKQQQQHENTTVKPLSAYSKCWLICQMASFEALWSLEKTIDDPTPPWSAVPFLRLVAQKRYPSKLCNFLCSSYHIGETCLVKEYSWSRNGAFLGDQKKKRPRCTSPVTWSRHVVAR